MDTSNLKNHYPKLLDYLTTHGYKSDSLRLAKSCIAYALTDGRREGIQSYEDLFHFESTRLGYAFNEGRYKSLKSAMGMLWDFDVNGRFPRGSGQRKGFMASPSKYSLLSPEFKRIIDNHGVIASERSEKTAKTISVEKMAGIVFFYFMQEKGARRLLEISPVMMFSFFSDGERQVRGHSYCHLVKKVLESAENIEHIESQRLISLLPHIHDRHKLYDYLKPEEAKRVFECLKNPQSHLSLLERSVGWILYFLGMRGTDIGGLKMSNLDWKHERMHITQSKTGVPLMVPMNAAIGNTLFDYITSERPQVECDTIFVGIKRPHHKFSALGGVINKVFKTAGVRLDAGSKGVRSMRHHLVTYMLNAGVDCATVSSIVGHKDGKSLVPYVDADIEHLRECAISVSQYPINPKILAL